MADEDKRKHLDLLQGAISRMAANSFLLKGWNVTLATAVFGLAVKESQPRLALLGLLPILTLWGLDAYYLGYERRFRELYTVAIQAPVTDFGMTPNALGLRGWLEAIFRPAVFCLHLPLALAALGICLLHCSF
jgi:hypothetical protein